MIDPVTNELYDNITTNALKCKLDSTEINVYNTSMLVSEEYGRSQTSRSAYLITPDEKIYNFQTYPGFILHLYLKYNFIWNFLFKKKSIYKNKIEIKNITPQVGSVLGGTHLSLFGSYFYSDDNLPAQIDIAGTPCQVLSYEKNNYVDSKLVCKTSAKPTNLNDYYGGRGISLIRDNVLTSFNNFGSASPSGSAVQSQLNSANFVDSQTVDVTVWLKGFFAPKKSSNYEFNLKTNAPAILYLSDDATSSRKAVNWNNFIYEWFKKLN